MKMTFLHTLLAATRLEATLTEPPVTDSPNTWKFELTESGLMACSVKPDHTRFF